MGLGKMPGSYCGPFQFEKVILSLIFNLMRHYFSTSNIYLVLPCCCLLYLLFTLFQTFHLETFACCLKSRISSSVNQLGKLPLASLFVLIIRKHLSLTHFLEINVLSLRNEF